MHRVRPLLGDSDPGVVALILQYLLDLKQVCSGLYFNFQLCLLCT